jgi:class 3 adenylate cyclase/tetratricopeptide (TPR) repeat protein
MQYCGQCGTRLEKKCAKCLTVMPPEFKFCGSCGYLLSATEADQADSAYGQPKKYTPPFLAQKILTSRSAIEGERKRVTVLFADVANYTTLAASMDPEEVHRIMDGCFQILMDAIHRYEGTINQFIGDGVMALFGAPVSHEDHAQRACHAALAIQEGLRSFSDKIQSMTGCEFKMRIGINSGPVVVGAIGDDLRMDYTAIGDTTNLAARLESLASPGTVLVSPHTYKLVKEFFKFKSRGLVKVKGREGLHEPWQLIKSSKIVSRLEASRMRGLSKFSGRDNETQILLDAFERARTGSGQLVGIVGEAGVGKSRLLMEFRNLLPKHHHLYMEGRCLPYGSSIAYLPLQDIIKSFFDIKESDNDSQMSKKLSEKLQAGNFNQLNLMAPFQELLSLTPDDEAYLALEAQKRREKTFEALRDFFILNSQQEPLVLVIEDLHWIDRTSEELLEYFIPWLPITPTLLILAYRSEYSHPWGSQSYYINVSLNHLQSEASANLIASILSDKKVSSKIHSFIYNRTSGNPLFLEEMTHTLLENDIIAASDEHYVLNKQISEMKIPDTIQGIISSRIDHLEDDLKGIIQVAAVIGRDFAYRILQTITDSHDTLKTTLLDLQRSEFIYEKRVLPELEYFFKHALTQEVAYNSILSRKRQDIHGKIGHTIEEIYGERLEEFYEVLAYHYGKSRNTAKAVEYLSLSGDKCTRIHSLWEAFRFYRDAIDLIKGQADSEENNRKHLRVLLQMSIPMRLLSYPDESLRILQEGEAVAEKVGDRRSLTQIYSIIGHCHALTGTPFDAIRYSENSFEEARKIGDIELMAPIACDLSTAYQSSGEHSKVAAFLPKVLELLEKENKEKESFGKPFNVYSSLHVYYGFSKIILGEFEEGRRILDKGLQFAKQINDLCAVALIELGHGHLYNIRREGREAVKHLENSIRLAEEVDYLTILGLGWTSLGWAQYLMGRKDVAIESIEKGMQLQLESGTKFNHSLPYYYLSYIYLIENELEKAKKLIDQALSLAQRNHQKLYEGLSWALHGRIVGRLSPEKAQQAEESIFKGRKILEDINSKTYVALVNKLAAEFYAEGQKIDKAVQNLKLAIAMFREIGMPSEEAQASELLKRLST